MELNCKVCKCSFERNRKRTYCSKHCCVQDPEYIEKLRLAKLGKQRVPHSEETKRKIRNSNKRRWNDPELIARHREQNLGANNPFFGQHHTDQARQKIGENSWGAGKINPWWKSWMLRDPTQRKWSYQVRSRYQHKCAKCFSTQKLHAHHIVPRFSDASLAYDLENGICLCRICHREVHQELREDPQVYQEMISKLIVGFKDDSNRSC